MFKTLLTWWSGPTLGTLFTVGRSARQVGTDEFGNRYFEARTLKGSYDKHKRRFVLYKGYADASKIPPDWHGWMHYLYDTPPSQSALPAKVWEQPHLPNLTGTPFASVPSGSLKTSTERAASSSDYEAWKP